MTNDDKRRADLLATAHTYARRGWRVIALHHVDQSGKCSCYQEPGEVCENTGKHPREKGWQKTPRLSGADVQALWEAHPDANVGIATGDGTGFFVLDVDPEHGGDTALAELEARHGKLPGTYTVQTGSGGVHLYFLLPDFAVTNSRGRLPDGLDIRGNNGQVVAPPSRSGKGVYTVAYDMAPVPAPAWLLDLIRPLIRPPANPLNTPPTREMAAYVQAALEGEVQRVMDAAVNRNNTLNEATFRLATIAAHDALDTDTITDAMTIAGEAIGLGPREVRDTVASGIRGGLAKPRTPWPPPGTGTGLLIPFTDDATQGQWPRRSWDDFGNADRLADHYGAGLRWIGGTNKWATYGGGRWTLDGGTLAQHLAQSTVDRLEKTEALSYSDTPAVDANGKPVPSERDRFTAFARKQRSAAKVAAMLTTAKGLEGLAARLTDFDADPMLLNVANGILDLSTGDLTPHSPTDMSMVQAPVRFEPGAACPRWQEFLDRVLPNPATQDYLQRVTGYSATGSTAEQAMFLHFGNGANGKSVYLDTIAAVLGGYSQVIPRATLMAKTNDNGIPNDVARMLGRRFLPASETGAGKRLDEELIKSLTGGEQVVARFMYGEFFQFRPTGKIHLATNHLPHMSQADSMWRRLHLIEWGVTVAPEDQVMGLSETMAREEGPGILNWIIMGCIGWLYARLEAPEGVVTRLSEYRSDEDTFGAYLVDKLMADPDGRTSTQRLYATYRQWCMETGTHPMTMTSYGSTLRERGFTPYRTNKERGYEGLATIQTQPSWAGSYLPPD